MASDISLRTIGARTTGLFSFIKEACETLFGRGEAQAAAANAINDCMKIFDANKPMLAYPDKIYPGQVLRIPSRFIFFSKGNAS